MKFTVQLVIEPGDGSTFVTEVATLERESLTEATLGLSLAESKMILASMQETMVAQQAASYTAAQQTCPTCGARCRYKETISNRGLTVPQPQCDSFLPGRNRTQYLAADLIDRGLDDGAELQAVAPGLKWSPAEVRSLRTGLTKNA
jgi:hypothetical protein